MTNDNQPGDKQPLDLNERIKVSMTRREAAALVIAVGLADNYPHKLNKMLDGSIRALQEQAPTGVWTRVMAEIAS